jgi:UDP-N-acetylmuramate dehydrogenase
MHVLENEPMSKHTSFRVGGPARYYVKAESLAELQEALAFARGNNMPHFILGNGTNVLVSDEGYAGVIITLAGEFSTIESPDGRTYRVGAASALGKFARATLKQGLAGAHKLAGIPGTLGGAIYMNAGAYGQEIAQHCTQVTSLDNSGNTCTRAAKECSFGYRHSLFQDLAKGGAAETILFATFAFDGASSCGKNVAELEAELSECMAKRKATQPLNMPNAGSTFKRLAKGAAETPTQIAPGYYIEAAGLKGTRIGGAEVSTLHANFIVNAGGATAKDIETLAELVQRTVCEKFGISLEREIILL